MVRLVAHTASVSLGQPNHMTQLAFELASKLLKLLRSHLGKQVLSAP